jgi:hypothetical protein
MGIKTATTITESTTNRGVSWIEGGLALEETLNGGAWGGAEAG